MVAAHTHAWLYLVVLSILRLGLPPSFGAVLYRIIIPRPSQASLVCVLLACLLVCTFDEYTLTCISFHT